MNRGTLYLHYMDKYDLLVKCIDEHLSNMFISCTPIDFDGEKIDLIRMLIPVFTYFENNYLFFSSMLSNNRTSVFRDRMLQVVADNIREKLENKDNNQGLYLELTIQFMASAFVGTVEWWILNKMPHPPQFMAEEVLRLFERNDINAK